MGGATPKPPTRLIFADLTIDLGGPSAPALFFSPYEKIKVCFNKKQQTFVRKATTSETELRVTSRLLIVLMHVDQCAIFRLLCNPSPYFAYNTH